MPYSSGIKRQVKFRRLFNSESLGTYFVKASYNDIPNADS